MTRPLRALIVDDVALARRRLVRMLSSIDEVDVVGECPDVEAAIDAVARLRPDVLFLDIEMPEQDGFSLLANLPRDNRPQVVFVTAFDQYAVRAFDSRALDYLLKPVTAERLAVTVDRLREERDATTAGEALRVAAAVLGQRASYPARITVRGRDATRIILTSDIEWIESAGNYVCVRVTDETHVLRETLIGLERRLDPTVFVRIHRSRIVNIACVVRLLPLFNGDQTVVLRDGTELTLSRTHRDALLSALETSS